MTLKRRQKAKDLIRLALADGTPDKESRTAAIRAIKLIEKYDLLSSPLDSVLDSENETVQAARTIFETLTNPLLANSVRTIGRQVRRARRR